MRARLFQLDSESLTLPNGRRVPLDAIEDWAMAYWGGNQTIQTDRWKGWRIVQQFLVPPGRTIRTCPIHINAVKGLVMVVEASKRRKKTPA